MEAGRVPQAAAGRRGWGPFKRPPPRGAGGGLGGEGTPGGSYAGPRETPPPRDDTERAASAGVVEPSAAGGEDRALLPAGAHGHRPERGAPPPSKKPVCVWWGLPRGLRPGCKEAALSLCSAPSLWEGGRERGRRVGGRREREGERGAQRQPPADLAAPRGGRAGGGGRAEASSGEAAADDGRGAASPARAAPSPSAPSPSPSPSPSSSSSSSSSRLVGRAEQQRQRRRRQQPPDVFGAREAAATARRRRRRRRRRRGRRRGHGPRVVRPVQGQEDKEETGSTIRMRSALALMSTTQGSPGSGTVR